MSNIVSLRAELTRPHVSNPEQLVVLLGPQGKSVTLASKLREFGLGARVASVTAGWQEREDEIQALREHLGDRTESLNLHRRAEEAFQRDHDLLTKHRERQAILRDLQTYYDLRLRYASEAYEELSKRQPSTPVLESEREAALDAIRAMDERHLNEIAEVHQEFDPKLDFENRSTLAQDRSEIREILARCDVLGIAGGHIATLLNRLRMFGVLSDWGDRPIFAWSGGAMVLCERIVLYHDSPPQGFGNPEVFELGFGVCRGMLALPHARSRLRLGDTERMARFARRFAPDTCVTMDDEACIVFQGGCFRASPETGMLSVTGRVQEVA